jgi:hypothetical protein
MSVFEWLKGWLKLEPLTFNEAITLVVALWGAFLSTYNWLGDRPRIKVRRERLPIVAYDDSSLIELRAVNVGKRSVTLLYPKTRIALRLLNSAPAQKFLINSSFAHSFTGSPQRTQGERIARHLIGYLW